MGPFPLPPVPEKGSPSLEEGQDGRDEWQGIVVSEFKLHPLTLPRTHNSPVPHQQL